MSSLKDTKLYELASDIGRQIFAQSEDLSEEERWGVQSKLRNRSADVISWSAEAVGSIDPRDTKWALGKARASLFVVEATYKYACDIGLLSLDPRTMAHIKQAGEEIDTLLAEATAKIPSWFEEMQPQADKKVMK